MSNSGFTMISFGQSHKKKNPNVLSELKNLSKLIKKPNSECGYNAPSSRKVKKSMR